jgi:hypothetical protein
MIAPLCLLLSLLVFVDSSPVGKEGVDPPSNYVAKDSFDPPSNPLHFVKVTQQLKEKNLANKLRLVFCDFCRKTWK